MKFIVAIDGTAASGKGTLAKKTANHFGFKYLDTGILYRVVAYYLKSSEIHSEISKQNISWLGSLTQPPMVEESFKMMDPRWISGFSVGARLAQGLLTRGARLARKVKPFVYTGGPH